MSTNIKDVVKEKYGQAALRVATGGSSCCGASAALDGCCDPITSNLYEAAQKGELPATAVLASLGCGNPTALAELKPGETVLDLGSGGGIDVLLSAKRVGPKGKAFGLDMTEEMLALANQNKAKAGVENVQFLKGEIENISRSLTTAWTSSSQTASLILSGNKDGFSRKRFECSSRVAALQCPTSSREANTARGPGKRPVVGGLRGRGTGGARVQGKARGGGIREYRR